MGSPPVQQETRSRTVGGSVTPTEEGEILGAFDQSTYGNKSRTARVILLAYTRSTKIRDEVSRFVREHPELLVD